MLEDRVTGPEYLDLPGFGLDEADQTFRMLVPVNRLFGGIRPQRSFFRRESRGWDRQVTYRILDVGCGVGDVAIALVRWARGAGYHLEVDCIDKHPVVVDLARENCSAYPEISVACHDVLDLHGLDYDYVHAAQFVHHFPDEEVGPLLSHLQTLCRSKLLVSDLVRAPLAYLSTWVFTLFSPPVFRHDARISVRRGFKLEELESLLGEAGFSDYRLERHFFYRFLLVMGTP
ncbi:MAG: methyltransferase domain-containing protein [Anaerolineae bacterium]|jgi:2-polyprenyl-3-methyl-5-hydroxy-6-metoxy-1,4-benzoquinol methylase